MRMGGVRWAASQRMERPDAPVPCERLPCERACPESEVQGHVQSRLALLQAFTLCDEATVALASAPQGLLLQSIESRVATKLVLGCRVGLELNPADHRSCLNINECDNNNAGCEQLCQDLDPRKTSGCPQCCRRRLEHVLDSFAPASDMLQCLRCSALLLDDCMQLARV